MTEIPDTNGLEPDARVFYDDHCPVCRATLDRWRTVFEDRRIVFHAMREPWVRQVLRIPTEGFPQEMKLQPREGPMLGGLNAVAWMCRRVWWLWPAGVLMVVPGLHHLARMGYRYVARNRYCLGDVCPVATTHPNARHIAATTFLEMP
jgi:predicted DCC family thiol-disulfide oxidoreductase YuxK